MVVVILWILLSVLVGNAGKLRKIGGATAFFCSLFFSPLIGLLAVLASDKLHEPPVMRMPPASVADELTKLKALHDSGALTEAEYEAQKARLLA